jgi:hypothetical protein
MIGALTNHLWQSTVFAVVAGLLTVGFRSNRAQVRYWLWFSASFKFFVPFSLLIGLGSRLGWASAAKKIAAPVLYDAASIPMGSFFAFYLGDRIGCDRADSVPGLAPHSDSFALQHSY